MNYIGRFAPTPTGPLHIGSLIAAVASYCDARAASGQWLLRMEDIDPPREMPGASDQIQRQLEAYGLEWDSNVMFQNQRTEAYLAALEQLQAQGDIFWCRCSRTDIARLGSSLYPGTCRVFTSARADAAIRLHVPDRLIRFDDRLRGPQAENPHECVGDFVLRRRDGLFSYQLAVVVDDAFQNITDVVRGADLLDNTARQIVLQQLLHLPTPRYLHLPLAVHADGTKLSKQTFAAKIPIPANGMLLWDVLDFLGQHPPADIRHSPAKELLAWGVTNWKPEHIPARQGMAAPGDPASLAP